MEEVLLSSLVGAVVGTISQIFREWWIQNKAEDKARDFAIFCLVNELKQFRYGCFAFLDSHNGAVISNKYDSFESENTTWGEIQESLSVPSLSLNISHVNLINMTLVAEYHALSRECEYIKHRFTLNEEADKLFFIEYDYFKSMTELADQAEVLENRIVKCYGIKFKIERWEEEWKSLRLDIKDKYINIGKVIAQDKNI